MLKLVGQAKGVRGAVGSIVDSSGLLSKSGAKKNSDRKQRGSKDRECLP